MPVFTMIAASALAAAQWPAPVVDQDDYPMTAMLQQKSAASILEILIDPQGNVVKCTKAGSVGDEQLASQMCKIAQRKTATPARDAKGKSTFGFSRELAILALPGTSQADQIGNLGPSPDLDVEVASIPAGSKTPVLVDVTIAVDQAGKTTGCDYRRGGSNAAFAAVACNQATQMAFDKLTDSSGSPISYVRPLSVRFTLAGDS